MDIRKYTCALASVAPLSGAASHRRKGRVFDSWAGHILRLWIRSWSRRQPIDVSLSHKCFFLPLSVPLSKSYEKKMSSGEDKKKKTHVSDHLCKGQKRYTRNCRDLLPTGSKVSGKRVRREDE